MQSAVTQRVVALVDMDCFYCQVETKLNPCFKSKPLAVVQYNQWKGGGYVSFEIKKYFTSFLLIEKFKKIYL